MLSVLCTLSWLCFLTLAAQFPGATWHAQLVTTVGVVTESAKAPVGSDTAPTVMPFFGLRAAHHGRVGQDS